MHYTEKTKKETTVKKVIRPKQDEISIQLKVEDPKVRYLKLHPFYRWSKSNLLYKPQGKIVPELRLCGNWLKNAGFLPDDYVSVIVMDGLLIIQLAKGQNECDDER